MRAADQPPAGESTADERWQQWREKCGREQARFAGKLRRAVFATLSVACLGTAAVLALL